MKKQNRKLNKSLPFIYKHLKINSSNNEPIGVDLRYHEFDKPIPLFVFCHGFKGFKDWGFFPYMMEKLSENGIFTVSFNFSRNGLDNNLNNPEEFTKLDLFRYNTITQELNDLDRVLDFLEASSNNYNYNFNKLVISGHSRGGGVAILKTSEDKRIKKLICLAPISTFDRYGKHIKQIWKDRGFIEIENVRTKQKMPMDFSYLRDLEINKNKFDILAAIKKVSIPTLIIHGDADISVDISEAEALFEHSNKKLTQFIKLQNSNHTFGATHPFISTNDTIDYIIKRISEFVIE
ncbi:MAG: alpha/beta hydrolase family protein [Ignavibacteria bacterium]